MKVYKVTVRRYNNESKAFTVLAKTPRKAVDDAERFIGKNYSYSGTIIKIEEVLKVDVAYKS